MAEDGASVLSEWLEALVDRAVVDEAIYILNEIDSISLQEPTPGFQSAVIKAREYLVANSPTLEAKSLFLNSLSNDYAAVGRNTEALSAIEEAVTIRRSLSNENPARYSPDLAMSLNNLSAHLSDAGRVEESLATIEEAMEIYRDLADENPARYAPDMASSLNNLSAA